MTTPVLSPYSGQAQALVSSASSDAGAGAAPDDGVAYLTPDALMAYCQGRLSSIDEQIDGVITSQKSTIADVNDINNANAVLQKFSGGTTSKDDCQQMETSLRTAIEDIAARDPNCPVLPTLKQAYNDLVWTGTGTSSNPYYDGYAPNQAGDYADDKINSTEMASFTNTLNNATATLNSGAELQLVNVQSLMSQRDTTVQLTTNLVQSLGDEQTKIADNVGH